MTSSMTGSRGPTGLSTNRTSTGQSFKEKIPKGYKAGTLQQFTPEQLELLQHVMGFAGPESFLSRLAGGDQSLFEQMEAPALRQFSELQGGIGSRFSQGGGSGGGGQQALSSRRSSGFQNFGNQAAANFAQQLQGNRLDLQRQATTDLRDLAQMLLGQRPFERTLTEKPKSFLESFGTSLAGGVGQGFGKGFGDKLGGWLF